MVEISFDGEVIESLQSTILSYDQTVQEMQKKSSEQAEKIVALDAKFDECQRLQSDTTKELKAQQKSTQETTTKASLAIAELQTKLTQRESELHNAITHLKVQAELRDEGSRQMLAMWSNECAEAEARRTCERQHESEWVSHLVGATSEMRQRQQLKFDSNLAELQSKYNTGIQLREHEEQEHVSQISKQRNECLRLRTLLQDQSTKLDDMQNEMFTLKVATLVSEYDLNILKLTIGELESKAKLGAEFELTRWNIHTLEQKVTESPGAKRMRTTGGNTIPICRLILPTPVTSIAPM